MAKGYSTIPPKHRSQTKRELEGFMNAFKKRRVELELTQEDMAEGAGVSIETIRNIEQHRRVPSLPLFFHLARFLNLKVFSSKD